MLVFALHSLYFKCFFFFGITRKAFETCSTGKIVVVWQKLLNITAKLEPTYLFRPNSFSKMISNCSILQKKISKLDRYNIISHSGSKCPAPNAVFTSFIYKHYNFYYPTFFLLKICFPCTYYEYITPLKRGGHHARSGENSHSLTD